MKPWENAREVQVFCDKYWTTENKKVEKIYSFSFDDSLSLKPGEMLTFVERQALDAAVAEIKKLEKAIRVLKEGLEVYGKMEVYNKAQYALDRAEEILKEKK